MRPISAVIISYTLNTDKLKDTNKERYYTSTHDQLTGLQNRSIIIEVFNKLFCDVSTYNHSFPRAMIDLDHFISINIAFGHRADDYILRKFGLLIKEHLREADYAGRYEGEGFLLVIAHSDLNFASRIIERLLKNTRF